MQKSTFKNDDSGDVGKNTNNLIRVIKKLSKSNQLREQNLPDLFALAYHIIFELDETLSKDEKSAYIRIGNLTTIAKELEKFIDDECPDQALLDTYTTCVTRLAKLTKEVITPGNYRQYHHWLKRSIVAGDMLVALEPENVQYRKSLAGSLDEFGDTRVQPWRARGFYEMAREHRQKVVELENENLDSLLWLARSYELIGDTERKSSPETAIQWYLKCLLVRSQMIEMDPSSYRGETIEYPLLMIINLGGPRASEEKIDLLEMLLIIADNVAHWVKYEVTLPLMINKIVNELHKAKPKKNKRYRKWIEVEAEALERVVSNEAEEARYFWWLSNSYKELGSYFTKTDSDKAISYYLKCLNAREKVIALDGERLCYSCGVRGLLRKLDRLMESQSPETQTKWYRRWLSVAESCKSLCCDEEVFNHQQDIEKLRQKLSLGTVGES